MSKKIESYGNIKDGKLSISYRDRFVEALKNFKDCRVRIIVEKVYRKRSLMQNAYHFGVVVYEFIQGVKEEWGEDMSTDQAHEYLKLHCNYKEVLNERTGEIIRLPQSTAKLTTVEFMEFNDKCAKLIAEYFGRTVPEPGEQAELKL